jgi:signal peptidase I
METPSAKLALYRRALAGGIPLRSRIRGTSMLPTLWSGDSVSVRPATLADVRPGDIAVFLRNRHLVAHRVVRREVGRTGVSIVTRGDAQRMDDPPIQACEMLGVVSAVHRWGGDWPVRRRSPALARGLAWMIQRSPAVRSMLDRINAVRVNRASPEPPKRTGARDCGPQSCRVDLRTIDVE